MLGKDKKKNTEYSTTPFMGCIFLPKNVNKESRIVFLFSHLWIFTVLTMNVMLRLSSFQGAPSDNFL